MTAFISVVVGFLAKLIGAWLAKTPAPIVEAEKAGAAQAQLSDLERANANAQSASSAASAAAAAVASDGGLRRYEAADPNNRDNR